MTNFLITFNYKNKNILEVKNENKKINYIENIYKIVNLTIKNKSEKNLNESNIILKPKKFQSNEINWLKFCRK